MLPEAKAPDSSTGASRPTPKQEISVTMARAREGAAGRLKNPARPTYPRTSALRIGHFTGPHDRRVDRSERASL